MKSSVVAAFVAVWLLAGGAYALCACGGCNQNTPTPAQQLETAQYGAELHACVQNAKTRTEADTCRANVERKYSDGGDK